MAQGLIRPTHLGSVLICKSFLVLFSKKNCFLGLCLSTGGVILAAVAVGVAHALVFVFVELGELVLFVLGAETQFVDQFEGVAQGVETAELALFR